jgi:hypothetical protein
MLRLHFRAFEGRPLNNIDVTDRITGRAVGLIRSNLATSPTGMDVSLFDSKYRASVESYQEALGFVRGVETVLNHMTDVAFAVPMERPSEPVKRRAH